MGVAVPRALPGVGQAHADRGPGGPGHHPRPEEALEVDRQVEPPPAEPEQEPGGRGDPAGPEAQPRAVERDDLVEVGVAVQQSPEPPVDHPGQVGVGPVRPEGRQDRERVDDVAQRTRLDEADPPGSEVAQGG